MKVKTPPTIAGKVTIALYSTGSHKLYAKSSYALAIVVYINQRIHMTNTPHMELKTSQEALVAQKTLPTKNPYKKMNK